MMRFFFVTQIRSDNGDIDPPELMVIDSAEYEGERLVKLLYVLPMLIIDLSLNSDPKKRYKWTGRWSNGGEQWTPQSMQYLNHRFGHEGVSPRNTLGHSNVTVGFLDIL